MGLSEIGIGFAGIFGGAAPHVPAPPAHQLPGRERLRRDLERPYLLNPVELVFEARDNLAAQFPLQAQQLVEIPLEPPVQMTRELELSASDASRRSRVASPVTAPVTT